MCWGKGGEGGGEDSIFGSSVNFAPLKVGWKCHFENLKQDSINDRSRVPGIRRKFPKKN